MGMLGFCWDMCRFWPIDFLEPFIDFFSSLSLHLWSSLEKTDDRQSSVQVSKFYVIGSKIFHCSGFVGGRKYQHTRLGMLLK